MKKKGHQKKFATSVLVGWAMLVGSLLTLAFVVRGALAINASADQEKILISARLGALEQSMELFKRDLQKHSYDTNRTTSEHFPKKPEAKYTNRN